VSERPLCILKFGSSILHSPGDLPIAALEIYREVRRGQRVVAVVSAFAGVTDALLSEATRFADVDDASIARLLATGEAASAARLALQLDDLGIPAQVLEPHRVSLRTRGPRLDATPDGVDAAAFDESFEEVDVVIVCGFVGCDEEDMPTLLGRGGSDLTAIFLGHRLQAAECRLVKDVPGLFPADPNRSQQSLVPYVAAPWSLAAEVGGRLVQPKALKYAEANQYPIHVARPGAERGTRLGPAEAHRDSWRPPDRTRVALVGLGTVGTAVYEWLRRDEERFEIVGIAVHDTHRRRASYVDPDLLTDDGMELLELDPDVLVELCSSADAAHPVVERAIDRGISVVTSNRELVATRPELIARAKDKGTALLYSATVGGAVPVLEQIARMSANGGVARVDAVLNGASTYILERICMGSTLDAAIREAQVRGFARSNAEVDVDGSDVVFKAIITAMAAFDARTNPDAVLATGLDGLRGGAKPGAWSNGCPVRLVARIDRFGDSPRIRVEPESLDVDDFLAGARNDENRVRIEGMDGSVVHLRGRGAGADPTSIAIMADIMDLHRDGSDLPAGTSSREFDA
jgi:homoserine dehydrogenase